MARVLHAQKAVSGLRALLFQPGNQLLEAGYGVGKLLVDELVRAIGPADGRVKGSLGDINSDKKSLFMVLVVWVRNPGPNSPEC